MTPGTKRSPTLDASEGRPYIQWIYEEKRVQTRIQRWGNSLGLRIPRALALEAGVEAGSEVDLSIRDGELIMRPGSRRKYRLSELLRNVTTKNLHSEVATGAPVGGEIW